MRRRKLILYITILAIIIILALAMFLSACSQQASNMQDGYYTAEAAAFDSYGWKEYITIYVSNEKILTVEYDAYNASGFVKSWDVNYMRVMKMVDGTYPNEYTRTYAVALINWQEPAKVDAISGASHSHASFQLLAQAAIAQAKTGNKQVVQVELPES